VSVQFRAYARFFSQSQPRVVPYCTLNTWWEGVGENAVEPLAGVFYIRTYPRHKEGDRRVAMHGMRTKGWYK
jgi:hypothetical protein